MTTPLGGFRYNDPMSSDNSFAINSKIMIVAVVVLFGVVIFILGLHIYAKWFWRHGGQNGTSGVGWRRRRRLEFAVDWPRQERMTQVGLEKSLLDQLPTFIFDDKTASVKEGALECAVCLEEFVEGEKVRLLPKCNHSFHIDCINMWFHSHSTCPLCRCSVAPESPSTIQQPPAVAHDSYGVHSPSGDVVVNISDGVEGSGVAGDYHFDNHQERPQASSAATVVAVVEHGAAFHSPQDSAVGVVAGLPSPRQQQQPPSSRPASPSSRRPSTGLSPKPSGIQYPANVLFWGNQTQMNAAGTGAGAVAGGDREENTGLRRLSSGVHAPNSLVIEIPRALPLDGSVGPGPHHSNTSSDEPHRASDAHGGAGPGGPRSPIGRLVTSSFRRFLSIRRGPTSPGPEGTCSSFECEQQQQQQGPTISSSTGPVVQGLRQA